MAWGASGLQSLIGKVERDAVSEVYIFSGRSVRDDDWRKLMLALVENRSVQRLAISGHALPESAIEPLQRVLHSHPLLSSLAILPSNANDSNLSCLLALLPSNEDNEQHTSHGSNLRSLDLSGKSISSPAHNLTKLLSLLSLRCVDLSGNPITSLRTSDNPSLQLPNLESLRLANTSMNTDAIADTLRCCTELLSLDISYTCQPNNNENNDQNEADEALARALIHSPATLTTLRLSSTAAGSQTLRTALHLSSSCALQELYASSCTGNVDLRLLLSSIPSQRPPILSTLDLSRNMLQPTPTPRQLEDFLHGLPALQQLDVSECGLDDTHLVVILSSALSLQRLSFRGNPLTTCLPFLTPPLSSQALSDTQEQVLASCPVHTIDLTATSLSLAILRSILNLKLQLQLPNLSTLEIGANPCTDMDNESDKHKPRENNTSEDEDDVVNKENERNRQALREVEEWARDDPSINVTLIWQLGSSTNDMDANSALKTGATTSPLSAER